MAEVVGTGVVEVIPDTKKFGAALNAQTKDVTKGLARAGGPLGKLNQTISDFGVSSTFAFAAAGAAALGFAKSAIDSYSEHEQALTTLKNALADAPTIIDKSTAAFTDQATQLQNLTGVQDEEIIKADAVLARFGLTEDQLKKLTPLVLDYAQVTGQDATQAAEGIGKALLGNTKALKSVGIQFKATGDRAADVGAIMDALQGKVGGAAEAFGSTFEGKLKRLNAQFDDLKEVIGQELVADVSALLGPLVGLIGLFDQMKVKIDGVDVSLLQFLVHLGIGLPQAMLGAGVATGGVTGALTDQQAATDAAKKATQQLVAALKVGGDASKTFTDPVNGVTFALYDANAAMKAFIQSIDVYLGKIKNPALHSRNRIVGGVAGGAGFQMGGVVPGGYGGGDIVPAMLEPGEVVIPKEQARAAGASMTGLTLVFHGPVYGMDDFENRIGAAVAQVFAKAAR